MTRLAATLRFFADLVDATPEPAPASAYVTTESVFEGDEDMERQRREDAMRLLDPQTHGYVLLVVRDRGSFSKVEPSFALRDEMWAPIRATMAKVDAEAQRVYSERR